MLHSVAILTSLAAGAFVFSAMHDIAFRTVPDWTSLALTMDGTALRLLDHDMPAGLACGAATFIVATLCWRAGWLGGGDVKLLGASAILLSPALVPNFILAVALAGGVLAVMYLALERLVPALHSRPGASFVRRIFIVECRRIRRRASLPYAAAISAAALLMLARS